MRADTFHCVAPADTSGASAIVWELKSVFFECGASAEILTDNAPAFCSQTFLTLTDELDIWMRYWSAYIPEGNDITEQCHCTVKRIAARSHCLIVEAMYWYNATPKDNKTPSSMPANGICQYEQHVKGIDPKPSLPDIRSNTYHVGEPVWVKPLDCWCTTRVCKRQVDGVICCQTVLLNGTPHHVKDLRRCDESAITKKDESDRLSSSEMGVMVTCESEGQHLSAQLMSEECTKDEDDQTRRDGRNAGNLTEEHPTLLQRSTCQKRELPPYHIYDHEIRVSVVKLGWK